LPSTLAPFAYVSFTNDILPFLIQIGISVHFPCGICMLRLAIASYSQGNVAEAKRLFEKLKHSYPEYAKMWLDDAAARLFRSVNGYEKEDWTNTNLSDICKVIATGRPTLIEKRLKGKGNLEWLFFQEVATHLAAVRADSHPNIVNLAGVSLPCAVLTDCCPGGSLDSLLWRWDQDQCDDRKHRTAAKVIVGILTGMTHIHKTEIVRGGLKPGNVCLMDDYEVMIGYFGSARSAAAKKHPWRVTGTTHYRRRPWLPATAEDDLHAFGWILWEVVRVLLWGQGSAHLSPNDWPVPDGQKMLDEEDPERFARETAGGPPIFRDLFAKCVQGSGTATFETLLNSVSTSGQLVTSLREELSQLEPEGSPART
jgi:serine/threonine protein kinase